ncbi:MAG: MarR family transcriptional regulator [Anaerolineae bacterium]|nr:MarR family transcriptional regulator [Anaerolineae bacterium]
MLTEELVKLTTNALHRLSWSLRIDQLGTWSPVLRGMAQLDLHVLKLIAEFPNILPKEICAELHIPPSTLTSALNRLEKRGLLQRQINRFDRRSFQLELTPKGWEMHREHERVDELITSKVLDALDNEEETRIFIKLLAKVSQQLEEAQ